VFGMRITGNRELDPDFSKVKRSAKILGTIAERDLYAPGSKDWLIPRINPQCDNCGSKDPHQITMSYHTFPLPFIKQRKRYHIVCAHCGESVELEYAEFLKIKPHMVKD
jgi:hypothetical protein